uniref:Ig-like domain-containing protein n=1 Tax=Terrapene triunguis TaxID=2587831 RepID=A0A674JZ40_9SAUR
PRTVSTRLPFLTDIKQPVTAETSERSELNLTCAHPSVTDEWIFWYRQFPRQGPHFIAKGYSKTSPSTEPEGALHISEDRKSSSLSLRRARLADAAVYYCALRDTV